MSLEGGEAYQASHEHPELSAEDLAFLQETAEAKNIDPGLLEEALFKVQEQFHLPDWAMIRGRWDRFERRTDQILEQLEQEELKGETEAHLTRLDKNVMASHVIDRVLTLQEQKTLEVLKGKKTITRENDEASGEAEAESQEAEVESQEAREESQEAQEESQEARDKISQLKILNARYQTLRAENPDLGNKVIFRLILANPEKNEIGPFAREQLAFAMAQLDQARTRIAEIEPQAIPALQSVFEQTALNLGEAEPALIFSNFGQALDRIPPNKMSDEAKAEVRSILGLPPRPNTNGANVEYNLVKAPQPYLQDKPMAITPDVYAYSASEKDRDHVIVEYRNGNLKYTADLGIITRHEEIEERTAALQVLSAMAQAGIDTGLRELSGFNVDLDQRKPKLSPDLLSQLSRISNAVERDTLRDPILDTERFSVMKEKFEVLLRRNPGVDIARITSKTSVFKAAMKEYGIADEEGFHWDRFIATLQKIDAAYDGSQLSLLDLGLDFLPEEDSFT